MTIRLPPLRERKDDIGPLFLWFVEQAVERHGRSIPDVSDALIGKLMAFSWPGNVRELKNMAERYVLGMAPELEEAAGASSPGKLPQQLLAYEKLLLEQALQTSGGSVADAAQTLGLPRKTLYDKLARFNIDPQTFRSFGGT